MAFGSRNQGYRWRFNRLGGFDQVLIETGEDICHLEELDQKLWAALSCPHHRRRVRPAHPGAAGQ